jgi:putative endonuclease
MSRNRKLGDEGEEIASAYLQNNGYTILERNWTTGHKEIDIIAMVKECVVFVEVKTRRSTRNGMPEESVSPSKMNSVTEAARIYLQDLGVKDIRFDVIAILMPHGGEIDLLHIQDAFY